MTKFFGKQTSGGSITEKRVNPDLQAERAKCTFDQNELIITLIGEDNVRYVEEVATDLRKNPELCFKADFLEMGREEQMHAWWKKLRAFYDIDK